MNRLGMWSALALFLLGVVYAVTLAIGITATGFVKPIVDPVLAIMEVLTLLSAPLLVIMMAAVHASASPDYKAYSSAALAFNGALLPVTCLLLARDFHSAYSAGSAGPAA